MVQFWIAAALMLLIGFAFFLPVVMGKGATSGADRAKLNLLLHRQRQQELAQEAASPEALLALGADSERNLLGDLESVSVQEAPAQGGGRAALIMTLVAMPLAGLLAYFALGRPDLIGLAPPSAEVAAQSHAGEMEASVQRLADRLKENPNDLQGWTMLGRSLLMMKQPQKAVTAFEYALKLAPEDLDVKARYAEALADAGPEGMAGKPMEIVQEILQKSPNHQGALWLAGVAAAERKDGAKAAEYWRRLQAQFAPDSQEAQQLDRYIAQAQGKPMPAGPMQAAAKQAAGEPAKAAGGGMSIRVKVALSDSLKAKAAPDDALFIYARAAEGPPMPLAVAKKRVSDLPLDVVLDDSMSMMPGMNLSSFPKIVIGARISKSGRPTTSPGDLQGQVGPLAPEKGHGYAVTVDSVAGEGPTR
jgi:cytochrome c-type biogenesis protein CcmH